MHDPQGMDKNATVQHFYDKLLLLKESMNTLTAQRLAEDRDRFMRSYLEQFYAEWEGIC